MNFTNYFNYDSKKIINFMKENNLIVNNIDNILKKELTILFNICEPIYNDIFKNININLQYSKKKNILKKKRPVVLQLLFLLFKNDKETLNNIFEKSKQHNKNVKNKTIFFIENIYNYNVSNEEFYNWMNDYGTIIQIELFKLIKNGYFKNIEKNLQEIYGRFTPIDIQFEIENFLEYTCFYQSKYKNFTSNIEFRTENISLKKYYLKILMCRSIFMLVLNNSCNTNYIKCWMSKKKKKIPFYKINKKNIILGVKEVNTGSTYIGDCNRIVLWRKEELLKVLIHELLHCLEIDFHSFPENLSNSLKKCMKINEYTEIRVFESYVEIWANIFNSIITVIDINNKFKIKNPISKYLYCINLEICFSCFQAAKILLLYGFKNFKNFYSYTGKNKSSNEIKQNSSIISYYIIRSSLLFSLNKFLLFCRENNIDYNKPINFLDFKENVESHQNFYKLILFSMNNIKYQNYINKIIKLLEKIKDKSNFQFKTLRMSCIEFY